MEDAHVDSQNPVVVEEVAVENDVPTAAPGPSISMPSLQSKRHSMGKNEKNGGGENPWKERALEAERELKRMKDDSLFKAAFYSNLRVASAKVNKIQLGLGLMKAEEMANVDKCGWLAFSKDANRQLYFVLNDSCLFVFQKPSASTALGIVNLSGCSLVRQSRLELAIVTKSSIVDGAVLTQGKRYDVTATSSAILDEWASKIIEASVRSSEVASLERIGSETEHSLRRMASQEAALASQWRLDLELLKEVVTELLTSAEAVEDHLIKHAASKLKQDARIVDTFVQTLNQSRSKQRVVEYSNFRCLVRLFADAMDIAFAQKHYGQCKNLMNMANTFHSSAPPPSSSSSSPSSTKSAQPRKQEYIMDYLQRHAAWSSLALWEGMFLEALLIERSTMLISRPNAQRARMNSDPSHQHSTSPSSSSSSSFVSSSRASAVVSRPLPHIPEIDRTSSDLSEEDDGFDLLLLDSKSSTMHRESVLASYSNSAFGILVNFVIEMARHRLSCKLDISACVYVSVCACMCVAYHTTDVVLCLSSHYFTHATHTTRRPHNRPLHAQDGQQQLAQQRTQEHAAPANQRPLQEGEALSALRVVKSVMLTRD
jgi:hypothetical protein